MHKCARRKHFLWNEIGDVWERKNNFNESSRSCSQVKYGRLTTLVLWLQLGNSLNVGSHRSCLANSQLRGVATEPPLPTTCTRTERGHLVGDVSQRRPCLTTRGSILAQLTDWTGLFAAPTAGDLCVLARRDVCRDCSCAHRSRLFSWVVLLANVNLKE